MTAVKAAQRGAFEYLPKPFDLQELLAVVGARPGGPARPAPAAGRPRDAEERLPLIGRSPAMQEIYRTIARLTTRRPDGDDQRRIRHRQGTGGARAARLRQAAQRPVRRHQHGGDPARTDRERAVRPRARRLHRRHATAATGRFEQANGGTLFLDEIGDMPPEAQTRLLRVLQEGEFTTVGGRQPIRANVRIIAATHRDLRTAIRQGLFREDLFYRLNVVPIRLPPLRERTEDIADAGPPFPRPRPRRRAAGKSLDQAAVDAAEAPSLARQRARAGKPDAPARRALSGRGDRRRRDRGRTGRGRAGAGAARRRAPRGAGDAGRRGRAAYPRVPRRPRRRHGAVRASTTGCSREVERPLIRLTLAATRGNQIKAAADAGAEPQHAAQEDHGTWTSRWFGGSPELRKACQA